MTRVAMSLLAVLALLSGCSAERAADRMEGPADGSAADPADGSAADEDAADRAPDAPEPAGDRGNDESSSGVGPDAAAEAANAADLPEPAPTSSGERIIKDGTVSVEVDGDRFDAAFSRVVAAATDLGGTVVSSTTTAADGGGASGSITVRVPVERYEQLLVGVGDIGTVVSREVTAQDVTAEFTDLESRLRHLRAQERFYLELLEQAETVGDAIAVQQELHDVQAQTEQVRGRIELLDARTTYSTLTVELFEPGAPSQLAGAEGARPDLGAYWITARDAFVNVVGGMLVVAFFLAPLLLPAALGALAWQVTRRRPATVASESR